MGDPGCNIDLALPAICPGINSVFIRLQMADVFSEDDPQLSRPLLSRHAVSPLIVGTDLLLLIETTFNGSKYRFITFLGVNLNYILDVPEFRFIWGNGWRWESHVTC